MKITRNHEKLKKYHRNALENHKKTTKNHEKHNIEKRRQRWLSPNNRISNNGNVCPKNISIAFDHHASLHLALTKYSVRDPKI